MKKLLLSSVSALTLLSAAHADVKVGNPMGTTGPVAELVAPVNKAVDLAEKNVNDQGGFFKNGEKYVIIRGDSACNPVNSVDTVTKLVNVEQVVSLVGPICSGAAIAEAKSVAIPAGVTTLAIATTSPEITTLEDEGKTDLLFRVAASDAFQGVVLADYAIKKGAKELAITYANDDYNAALAKEFKKAYEAKGGKVTAFEAHEPSKQSYRTEVASLGKKTKNLALFAYFGSSGITILRNSLETGAFDTFFGADGMVSDEVIKQLGAKNLSGLYFTNPASDVTSPAFQAFKKLADAAGVKAGDPFVAHGYDAAFLMALAIEKAGSADRSKIAAALREVANPPGETIYPGEFKKAKEILAKGGDINYVGASGPIDFDKYGDVTGLYQVNTVGKDGKWQSEIIK